MGDFPCPACCFLFQYQSPRALDVHRVQGPGASSYRAAPGRGPGWDRRRVDPAAWVPARSRAGARWGTAYPLGGRGFSGASGRSAPGGRRLRRGSPISPEKWGKEGRGQAPWTPFFMARSFPLARFGVVGRSGAVVGLFRGPCTCPDLDAHFAGAGSRKNELRCRVYHLRRLPLGKLSPKGD